MANLDLRPTIARSSSPPPPLPLSAWLEKAGELDLRNLELEWTRISSAALAKELAWMAAQQTQEYLDNLAVRLTDDFVRDSFEQFFQPSREDRKRLTSAQIALNKISGESAYLRLCAMVSAAAAVRAVVDNSPDNLYSSIDKTLRNWHGLTDTAPAPAHPLSADSALSSSLDFAIAAWRNHNTECPVPQVGAVRTWLRLLASGVSAYLEPGLISATASVPNAYSATAHRETWLLSYRTGDRATLGRLHVEEVGAGEGCLYAHPEHIGLLPMSVEFLAAISIAWGLARTMSGQSGNSAETHDYRWWLEGYETPTESVPSLRGGSHGAAFAVAFAQLISDEPIDPEFVVTGEVDANGNVGGVGFVKQKAAGALALPTITRVCVPEVNYNEACEGARSAGRDPGRTIQCVKTLADLRPYASGLPEHIRRLCVTEQSRILALASQRLQRTITSWEQYRNLYIPVTVEVSRSQPDTSARHTSKQTWLEVRDLLVHALILADSGLGKTALFWYEVAERCNKALELLAQNSDVHSNSNFGFYISAKSLSQANVSESPDELLALFAREIVSRVDIDGGLVAHVERHVSTLIENGNCVLYLDALDEAPIEVQVHLPRALLELQRDYPHVRIYMSMRPTGVSELGHLLDEWDLVTLLPFRPDQIKQTVFHWFHANPERAENLWQHIEKSSRHLKLFETPLLLWIACSIAPSSQHERSGSGSWSRRTDLLELFVDDVVDKWSRRPPLPSVLQRSAFRAFLAEFALGLLMQRRQGDFWTPDVVQREIDSILKYYRVLSSRDILQDLLTTGLLTLLPLRSQEYALMFSHMAVGDYLAGVCIAARANTGRKKEVDELISSFAGEPSWQDPLVYASVYLDNPVPFLDQLCDPKYDDETRRRLALAAHCLSEITIGL